MGSEAIAKAVVEKVRSVVGTGEISLHRPFLDGEAAKLMARTVEYEPVGYNAIREFEAAVAELCKVRYCVAVNSGTAALHLAMVVMRVPGWGQIRMPSLNFAAAASMARLVGVTPYFAPPQQHHDDEHTPYLGVHLLGRPDAGLMRRANWPYLIEDASEALGSSHNGRPCGSYGECAVLSFNNNKIVTTGGGGALLTDDQGLAERARHLATTAKLASPWFYNHDAAAFNYRMGNINAALGLAQLAYFPDILARKAAMAEAYAAALETIEEVTIWRPLPGFAPNNWLNTIEVSAELRDPIMAALFADGIACRALFTPLHLQRPYQDCPAEYGEMKRAENIFAWTICLPSGRPN